MLAATLKDNNSAKINKQTDDNKAHPQNGTTCPDLAGFGFSRHTSQRSKNQKSHFFANAQTKEPTIKSKFDD
ncbi:hypothetical protein [Thermoflexibacter ruber]|uniref:hypothetical protein n=1 Tax=Thermoflexibacter ruber TaxID=1003 RepID=UPI000B842E71|nr:hypothetical protein [Thermoflexibacter ruber]